MKHAIKSFIRLYGEGYAELCEYEYCDRSYDAGEWSGPAWDKIYEDRCERIMKLVADKFRIHPLELAEAIDHYERNAEENFRESLI